jgi:hypothetical protein
MIRRYNNLSLALGVPGLILQIVGFVLQRSAGKEALGLVVALLGTALLVTGLGFYALSRGRNPAWCLLGLLGIIGLVALALLKDLEPERRRKKKKRPRRIDESEEYEQDRPRKKRRPTEDDDEDDDDVRPRRRRRVTDATDDDEDEDQPLPRKRLVDDEDYEEADRSKRRTASSRHEPEVEPAAKKEPVREKQPAGVATRLIECAHCQKPLKVPASLAGKKVKCPACNEVFVVE